MNVSSRPHPQQVSSGPVAALATTVGLLPGGRRRLASDGAGDRRGRVPDQDIVVVGRQAAAAPVGKGRKRLMAVIVGALLGAAIHYGSLAVDEWAVIHVTDPETSRTAIA